MARTDPTIYMRIPQELKDALDAASVGNRRSLTAEVVARLQASFVPQASMSMSSTHKDATEIPSIQSTTDRIADKTADTMIQPLNTEQALKEYLERVEAILDSREERMREWWQKEFGYDPQAPQIKREPIKGPTRSPNAKKRKE